MEIELLILRIRETNECGTSVQVVCWHTYYSLSTFFARVSLPARAPKERAPECGTAILSFIFALCLTYFSCLSTRFLSVNSNFISTHSLISKIHPPLQ